MHETAIRIPPTRATPSTPVRGRWRPGLLVTVVVVNLAWLALLTVALWSVQTDALSHLGWRRNATPVHEEDLHKEIVPREVPQPSPALQGGHPL